MYMHRLHRRRLLRVGYLLLALLLLAPKIDLTDSHQFTALFLAVGLSQS